MKKIILSSISMVLVLASMVSFAGAQRIRLATTTSMEDSGLLAVLNSAFTKKYNIKVDVISVGTGRAIRIAENGDVDILLVHAPAAEKQFVAKGYGIERLSVMHNDFIIIGPADDPADLNQAVTIKEAMQKLIDTEYTFVSRGDDSGTHNKEIELWHLINKQPKGSWYLSVGQGMGAALRIASDKNGYTLSDRGTYTAYMNKLNLVIVFEGGKQLYNPYHVIVVNPVKHPYANFELAQKYIAFIRGLEGQGLIRNFRVNGRALFYPDVIK